MSIRYKPERNKDYQEIKIVSTNSMNDILTLKNNVKNRSYLKLEAPKLIVQITLESLISDSFSSLHFRHTFRNPMIKTPLKSEWHSINYTDIETLLVRIKQIKKLQLHPSILITQNWFIVPSSRISYSAIESSVKKLAPFIEFNNFNIYLIIPSNTSEFSQKSVHPFIPVYSFNDIQYSDLSKIKNIIDSHPNTLFTINNSLNKFDNYNDINKRIKWDLYFDSYSYLV